MNDNILFSATQLSQLLETGDCIVVDCRFDFSDANKGKSDWLAGHIPGAFYANLDHDLAAPIDERSGRHPLPDPSEFASYLASIGWKSGTLLIAYDGGSNAMSGRLWWLMRYFGQPAALLDGGLHAWNEAGLALESGPVEAKVSTPESLVPAEGKTVNTQMLCTDLSSLAVVDARAADRYSGANESLDTRAGHIPGALNRPFNSNLTTGMRFKDPDQLRSELEALLGATDPGVVVHSCGSGVTACHNLFAMELAGITGSRLYPGSWSEWIRDPARPIETGG